MQHKIQAQSGFLPSNKKEQINTDKIFIKAPNLLTSSNFHGQYESRTVLKPPPSWQHCVDLPSTTTTSSAATFTMLSILPPEILRLIFAHVDDRKTFCNILVTSRQFSQLVEPFLYAEIIFSEPAMTDFDIDIRRLELLHEALKASNGRRAAYILTFSSYYTNHQEGETLIEKVLAKAANLKFLRLNFVDTSHFFLHCPPFALTRFHGIFRCLGPEMAGFLESQVSLETIFILLMEPSETQPPVFSPTSFPNLKNLTIGAALTLPFLRTSADVRNLRINDVEHFPPISQRDKTFLASVRVLSCPPTSISRSLAPQLPNLEWLELLDGAVDISTLMDWSHGNHGLRGIISTCSSSPPPTDFRSLFDAIPTLEFVEYKYGYLHETSRRWYRDAPSSLPVRWTCNEGEEWLADWERDVVLGSALTGF